MNNLRTPQMRSKYKYLLCNINIDNNILIFDVNADKIMQCEYQTITSLRKNMRGSWCKQPLGRHGLT